MKNISNSKISYYGRNRKVFLNNPRYKSNGCVKTKPTLNQLINETHNQFIEKWGPFMEVNQPAIYKSMTEKKTKKTSYVVKNKEPKEEVKKEEKSYGDLTAYQKQRDAERQAELEKARAKQKQEVKFTFEKPRKDFSIYGGWVNAYEQGNWRSIHSLEYKSKTDKKYEYY